MRKFNSSENASREADCVVCLSAECQRCSKCYYASESTIEHIHLPTEARYLAQTLPKAHQPVFVALPNTFHQPWLATSFPYSMTHTNAQQNIKCRHNPFTEILYTVSGLFSSLGLLTIFESSFRRNYSLLYLQRVQASISHSSHLQMKYGRSSPHSSHSRSPSTLSQLSWVHLCLLTTMLCAVAKACAHNSGLAGCG
jgi:hypothetical protein